MVTTQDLQEDDIVEITDANGEWMTSEVGRDSYAVGAPVLVEGC